MASVHHLEKFRASNALLTLFIAWNVAQSVQNTKLYSWKKCVVTQSDRAAHPLLRVHPND